MIESLRIENLAIVEEAELEFGPGLNVLTGETGAGKSIVLGALSLLVGARAEPGTLREKATQGSVEALCRAAKEAGVGRIVPAMAADAASISASVTGSAWGMARHRGIPVGEPQRAMASAGAPNRRIFVLARLDRARTE